MLISPAAEALPRGLPPIVPPPPLRCPVWRNSTSAKIDWARPMPERQRKAWLRDLHAFDNQTKRDRGPQGCIGRISFDVIRALFFLQARTGELAPSKRAIARAAGVCERTAHDALTRLRNCGVIGWQRRVEPTEPGSPFAWQQTTSAYFFRPASEWRGYRPGAEPPPPEPWQWGAWPPLPDALGQWSELRREGASAAAQIAALQVDPADRLALALSKLGAAIHGLPGGKVCGETSQILLSRGWNAADWKPG